MRNGVGQGITEAWLDKGPGNSIYVACGSGSHQTNSISFELIGRLSEPGSTVTLIFDAKDSIKATNYVGEFELNCRSCAAKGIALSRVLLPTDTRRTVWPCKTGLN